MSWHFLPQGDLPNPGIKFFSHQTPIKINFKKIFHRNYQKEEFTSIQSKKEVVTWDCIHFLWTGRQESSRISYWRWYFTHWIQPTPKMKILNRTFFFSRDKKHWTEHLQMAPKAGQWGDRPGYKNLSWFFKLTMVVNDIMLNWETHSFIHQIIYPVPTTYRIHARS